MSNQNSNQDNPLPSTPTFPITDGRQWIQLKDKLKVCIVKRTGEINFQTGNHLCHPLDNQFLATFNHEQKDVIIRKVADIELCAYEVNYGNDPNNPRSTPFKKTFIMPKDREELNPHLQSSGYIDITDWLRALTAEFLAFFPNYPKHMTFEILELTDIMRAITEYGEN